MLTPVVVDKMNARIDGDLLEHTLVTRPADAVAALWLPATFVLAITATSVYAFAYKPRRWLGLRPAGVGAELAHFARDGVHAVVDRRRGLYLFRIVPAGGARELIVEMPAVNPETVNLAERMVQLLGAAGMY